MLILAVQQSVMAIQFLTKQEYLFYFIIIICYSGLLEEQ